MEPLLATILLFGSNFAPQGWALCQGQLLAISQNAAVFSLIGTFYGGNGTTNFALPDLRSRVPVGQGQGAGLSLYAIGQAGGTENVTLTQNQMPQHNHLVNVNSSPGNTGTPGTTTYLSAGPYTGSGPNATQLDIYSTTATNTNLDANTITNAGGSQPFSIIQPYLAVTYIIALIGVFPSRN